MRTEINPRSVASYFDQRAAGWSTACDPGDPIVNRILDNAGITAGDTVLDAACGCGFLFPLYLLRDVRQVLGVDISPEMARIAAKSHPDPRIQVICGDVEKLTPNGTLFDHCMLFNALPHFSDPGRLVRSLSVLLQPGGCLTIAHNMGRRRLNRLHRTRAPDVSRRLIHPHRLTRLMEPWFELYVVCSTPELYQVSGSLRPGIDPQSIQPNSFI